MIELIKKWLEAYPTISNIITSVVTAVITTKLQEEFKTQKKRKKNSPKIKTIEIKGSEQLQANKKDIRDCGTLIWMQKESFSIDNKVNPLNEKLAFEKKNFKELRNIANEQTIVILKIENPSGKGLRIENIFTPYNINRIDESVVPYEINANQKYCLICAKTEVPEKITGTFNDRGISFNYIKNQYKTKQHRLNR